MPCLLLSHLSTKKTLRALKPNLFFKCLNPVYLGKAKEEGTFRSQENFILYLVFFLLPTGRPFLKSYL